MLGKAAPWDRLHYLGCFLLNGPIAWPLMRLNESKVRRCWSSVDILKRQALNSLVWFGPNAHLREQPDQKKHPAIRFAAPAPSSSSLSSASAPMARQCSAHAPSISSSPILISSGEPSSDSVWQIADWQIGMLQEAGTRQP